MSDPHPIMALLLEHNTFVGLAEMPEDDIQPLDDQLNWGPGDVAILAGSNTPLERDFVVVRGLDPEQHEETFPDWEERMRGTGTGWNSHVLCEAFSRADPELSIGWFSRLKLMPITLDLYQEAREWIETGFPEHLPKWCEEAYQKYTEGLAKRAPHIVPVAVECPNCHQRQVELLVVRRIEYRMRAGRVQLEGNDKYVPINPPDETDGHTALLVCKNESCGATATLEDEEWQIPDLTN